MTTRPLYQQGRAGALSQTLGGDVQPTDYELVRQLRAIRGDGDEAMTAAEEFDPDFSLKLSACENQVAAEALLTDWLGHRTKVLEQTRDRLRTRWAEGIAARKARRHGTEGMP